MNECGHCGQPAPTVFMFGDYWCRGCAVDEIDKRIASLEINALAEYTARACHKANTSSEHAFYDWLQRGDAHE